LPQTKNVKILSQSVSTCPLKEQDYFNHEGSQNEEYWTPQIPLIYLFIPQKKKKRILLSSRWDNFPSSVSTTRSTTL
jgi:hypothetical protein